MFGFFASGTRYGAVCDVSRNAAKILVFSYDRERREFFCQGDKSAALPASSGKLDNFMRALAVCGAFIDEAIKRLGRQIDGVTVALPDNILISDVHNFRFIRPTPENPVTPDELTGLWRKLEDDAEKILFPQGATPMAHRLIPPEPEHFSMDGYLVRAETRPKGKELVMGALVSAWPEDFAEAFDAFQRHFPKIRFRALPQAAAVRDYVGFRGREDFSGLAIDIGACDSTLLLFSAGVLDDCWTLPFGGNDVTEALAREFKIAFAEAEALKHQWSEALLDEAASARAAAAAGRVIDYWKQEWGALLAARAEVRVIAPEIYLVGGGARLPILASAFSDADWLDNFSSGGRASVSNLLAGNKAELFSQTWPFEIGGEVIFSLVSRMIQHAGRKGL